MRLSTKVAYNTIIQAASKIISAGLGLIVVAYITRYLGRDGFGEYATIMAFLSFFAILADLGLTLVTVQMISQPDADQNKILGNLLGLRLVSAIIFLSLAPLTVLFFPYPPIIKIGVAIGTASFLFIALNQILVGLFQKNLRLDKVSIAEISSRLFLLVGVILTIKLNQGLIGILIAIIAANALSFLLHYFFSLSFAKIKLQFDFKVWQQIISKSWPLAITIFLNLLYLKTDTLLLSIIKRPSTIGILSEVGLYGAAYKIIDVLITFPFMLAGIILPLITFLWAEKNKDKFNKILQKTFDVSVIIALPILAGTQFVARPAMVLIAGKDFSPAAPILKILIIAAFFVFLGAIFSHAIIAIDKQKKIIGAYVFVAATSILGYFIFIPRFSYFGAAWVTVYSESAIALASFFLVYYYTKFLPSFKIAIKSATAAIIMSAFIFILNIYITNNLFIVVGASAIIYFFFLYLFRGLSRQDIMNLLNK